MYPDDVIAFLIGAPNAQLRQDQNGDAYAVLGAGPAGGLLVSASEQSNTANFHTEKLGRLEQVRYILVAARIVTSGLGEQYVKFYSDYSLEFEISMYADFIINTRKL
jgi:hypothetical protein